MSGFGCCDLNEADRLEFRGLWFVSVWPWEKFPRPSFRDAMKTAESPWVRKAWGLAVWTSLMMPNPTSRGGAPDQGSPEQELDSLPPTSRCWFGFSLFILGAGGGYWVTSRFVRGFPGKCRAQRLSPAFQMPTSVIHETANRQPGGLEDVLGCLCHDIWVVGQPDEGGVGDVSRGVDVCCLEGI